MVAMAEASGRNMESEVIGKNRFDGGRFAATLLCMVIGMVAVKAATVYLGGFQLAPYLLLLLLALFVLLSGEGQRRILLLAIFCVVGASLVAGAIPDATWDGNMYHKPAIIALHDGWNPWLFPEFSDWIKTRSELHYSAIVWQNNENSLWVSHYPNLSWLYAAALMDLGFGWESGKSLGLVVAMALYFYSRQMLLQYPMSRVLRELIAILLVACPPWLVQIVTNYVDGVTYIVSALIVLGILDKERRVEINVIIWSSFIILAGVKFTGALYAALFTVPFLLVRRPDVRQIAAWALLGAVVLSHPYLNHLVSGLNVGYPVTGSNRVLQGQVEEDVAQRTSLVALTRSLIARTSNGLDYPGSKVPGRLYPGEVVAAGSPDTRHGGFGPWYSLALLVGLAAVALAIIVGVRRRSITREGMMLLGAGLFLLLCVLIHPAAWWARYVPFLYVGLLLLMLFALSSDFLLARRLGVISLILLACNAVLVMIGAAGYAKNYAVLQGYAVDRQIVGSMSRNRTIQVRAPVFVAFSALYHLRETLGIQRLVYEPADLGTTPGCPVGKSLGVWIGLAQVCELEYEPPEIKKPVGVEAGLDMISVSSKGEVR